MGLWGTGRLLYGAIRHTGAPEWSYGAQGGSYMGLWGTGGAAEWGYGARRGSYMGLWGTGGLLYGTMGHTGAPE